MGSPDIKLRLKSHISKLVKKNEHVDTSESSAYWAPFWELPTSMDDIVAVFNPQDVRFIRDKNIDGLIKLLLNTTTRLIFLSKLKKVKLKKFPINQLLNCIRIITVILPFIYEKSHLNYIEDSVFWERIYHKPSYNNEYYKINSSISNGTTATTIGTLEEIQEGQPKSLIDLDDLPDSNSPSDSLKVNHDEMKYEEKPIGAELIDTCLNLLFTLDFTVESRDKTSYNSPVLANDYQPIVWEPGLEFQENFEDPKLYLDSNRLEILRLLLVLFSKSMYTSVHDVISTGSKFLTVLITASDGRKFYVFLLSLINLILRSTQSNKSNSLNPSLKSNNNPNGLDIQSEEHKNLRILMVTNSLQLFTLMAVYPLPKKDLSFMFKHNIISNKETPRNRARIFLGKILLSKDIQMIILNMTSPLFKPLAENDLNAFTYLMKTSKLIEEQELHIWSTELMMLLLEFFQCNGKFRALFAELQGPSFFVLLTYYIIKFKNEQKHSSFIKLCVYFLLIISADYRLSNKLLQSFDMTFYESLPEMLRISTSPNSYRDFLIIQICNIVGSDQNFSLVSPLLQTLYNLIPLHATVLEYNKRENKEVLGHRRISDLSKCPPSQISYGASTGLVYLINKLSKYNSNSPASEFVKNLDHLSLVLNSCCNAIFRDPYGCVVLIYVLSRNLTSLSRLNANIRRVSDQLFTDLMLKEKKDYILGIQQQQQQLQQQILQADELYSDTESRDSFDMPALSRQTTQNTFESVHSTRSNMPVISKQTSQISIASVSTGYTNVHNYNDESIDPMNTHNNNNNDNDDEENDLNDGELNNEFNSSDAIISDCVEEIFHAEYPHGLTQRSKEKKAYYETFDNKWSGKEALDLLRETLKSVNSLLGEDASEVKMGQQVNASAMIHKLLKLDLDSIISNIDKPDVFNKDKIYFHALKFKWTNLTLGWYISLIWANIYLNYNSFSSKGILAEISSGFSAIKRASSSWGFGSWKLGANNATGNSNGNGNGNGNLINNSPTNIASPLSSYPMGNSVTPPVIDDNIYFDNILKNSLWFGTHIQLFKINPVLLKEHFALQHGKSDLSSMSSDGNFNPVVWKRNSVSSPILGMRNGSGVFTEGFWKRQGGRPGSLDRRDSEGSLKMQLSRNSLSNNR